MISDPRFARWDRPLALLFLGIPAAIHLAATFVSNGATRIYSWPWAFYVQAALLAAWLWCAWSCLRGRGGLRSGWWIILPLLLPLALSIITSVHPHAALEAGLVLATGLIVVPFAADAWARAQPTRRLAACRTLGLALGALSVASLVAWAGSRESFGEFLRTSLQSRNLHTLGHWNYTGGLALLTLPVTALLTWRESGLWRLLWSLLSTAAAIQLVSSGSRGAILGAVAAAGVTAILLRARHAASRRQIMVGAFAVAVVCATAAVSIPRFRQALRDPASLLSVGESEQQRLGFLLTGLRLAQAHPWTGIGPGTTPYHYPEHRVDRPGSLENSFQLHCGPLQWWVDTGFLGLAALVFSAGFLKARTWRARRTLSEEAVAAIALLGGYGVMWLTDYQLDAPIFPLVLALATAVFLGETTPTSDQRGPVRRALPAFSIALVPVAGLILLISSWKARAAFSAAWTAKDENRPNEFVQNLRAAAEDAPWNPLYANHLARALAGISRNLPPETAAALRADARAAWLRSSVAAPAQDHPWLNLGWLSLGEGEPQRALDEFQKAAAAYPRRTGLWLGTALAQLARGRPEEAARALAREIRLQPVFITSPAWQHEPLSELRPQVEAMLASGWSSTSTDPGASPAPPITAFATWWWGGDVPDIQTSQANDTPTLVFLRALDQLDDRDIASEDTRLDPGLKVMREAWRTRSPIPETAPVPHDLATQWLAHVQANPSVAFTTLLRTHPGAILRRTTRSADGILFRQTDGDALRDLTEYPIAVVCTVMSDTIPKPAVDEFQSD